MLTIKPGGSTYNQEDLPIFTLTANVNQTAGSYYFAQGVTQEDVTLATVYDNSGKRYLRGIRVFCGAVVPTAKALSITPMISIDGGQTWSPINALGVAISGTRRGSSFVGKDGEMIPLPDAALLTYRINLTATFLGTVSVTLYLY